MVSYLDDMFTVDNKGNLTSGTRLLDPSNVAITDSGAGVKFSMGATPSNLPAGNEIGFFADISADADDPLQPNGVNPGEWVKLVFGIKPGYTYSNVLAELNPYVNTGLRVGIHVIGFESGGGESFLAVPMPAAVWGGALLLAALGRRVMVDFATEWAGADVVADAFEPEAVDFVELDLAPVAQGGRRIGKVRPQRQRVVAQRLVRLAVRDVVFERLDAFSDAPLVRRRERLAMHCRDVTVQRIIQHGCGGTAIKRIIRRIAINNSYITGLGRYAVAHASPPRGTCGGLYVDGRRRSVTGRETRTQKKTREVSRVGGSGGLRAEDGS